MATVGLRYFLLPVCLVVMSAGCQGVPPVPSHSAVRPENAVSDNNSYEDTDGDGGGLLGGLFGKKQPAKPALGVVKPSNSSTMVDPAVRQASAVQPLPKVDAPRKSKAPMVYLAEQAPEDGRPEEKIEEKESSMFSWLDFSPGDTYNDIKAAMGYGPDKKLAMKYFDEGLAFYKNKQFKQAAAKFKSAAGRWPDSTLEEDALFMQGESLFFADAYSKASDTFGGLVKKYDNSRHLDKIAMREFQIARYWDEHHKRHPHWPLTPNLFDSSRPRFDTFGNARKAYEMVAISDPTGPLADDALMALGNGYFLQKRYEEAADYYDRLRKEHPDSTHVIDAHLLLIKSKQLAYQGALYDGTPLEESGKLAEQTVRQFGTKLGAERDRLIEIQNRVDIEMANRDWAMADFYEGKKQYGAARYYYKQIIADYPQTEMARAAQKRLDEIKEYPDKPVDRFKFLTRLFPEN